MQMTTDIFTALGFQWDTTVVPTAVPSHRLERVCFRFHRMLSEFVWDASVLKGNPFTFPEVMTLLDGITVGGRKISDQEQVLNLIESSKHFLALVKKGQFDVTKARFCELQGIIARNEALEWGHFRGEGMETSFSPYVSLGHHGRYTPLPTVAGAEALDQLFVRGVEVLTGLPNPLERGCAFFLFGALQKFFFDGNKRTSRFMMNGILMTAGIDAISIPAARGGEFNEKRVRFYLTRDGTEMMQFLVSCHPDFASSAPNTAT